MPDFPVPMQKPISIQLNGELVALSSGVVTRNDLESKAEPFGINGTSYLHLRLISESLGAKVDWMQQEEKISIMMK